MFSIGLPDEIRYTKSLCYLLCHSCVRELTLSILFCLLDIILMAVLVELETLMNWEQHIIYLLPTWWLCFGHS